MKTTLTGNLIEFPGAESGPKPCGGGGDDNGDNEIMMIMGIRNPEFLSADGDGETGGGETDADIKGMLARLFFQSSLVRLI